MRVAYAGGFHRAYIMRVAVKGLKEGYTPRCRCICKFGNLARASTTAASLLVDGVL